MKINERSKFIINELIKRNTYVTASEIADLLQVSIKTVTRQLVNVEKILNENDLILDPFCGSSTTGIAASKLNRKYIGIDNNKDYLDLSIRRFKELGG